MLTIFKISFMTVTIPMVSASLGCKPFNEIYANGQELCENMWGGAFKYSEDEDNAYTMWFFDEHNNPNDEVTRRLRDDGVIQNFSGDTVDQCFLEFFHKDASHPVNNNAHPDEEPDSFQECHPWSQNSCCFQKTVESPASLNEGYGPGFQWDRCGPLSQACERFFVQEACFYECEPNAGLFRKFKAQATDPNPFGANAQMLFDPDNDETNAWEIHQMPIKASFCNAWHQACYNDFFCSQANGNYFSCSATDIEDDEETPAAQRGTCENACGQQSSTGPCRCDDGCETNDPPNCCLDIENHCAPSWVKRVFGSCEGNCNQAGSGECFCDPACIEQGDCCDDYKVVCSSTFKPGKCAAEDGGVPNCNGITKTDLDVNDQDKCWCQADCLTLEDCCVDYEALCL